MTNSTKISPSATILVTGGGGYVGAAVVDQLLQQGFKVRATTRTASKLDLLKKQADTKYGDGKLEVVEVPDLSVKGALDNALKGVEGVINVASDTSFGDNLQKIVETVNSLTNEVLSSVEKAGTVKSFVSTSSRIAAFNLSGNGPRKINESNWWDEAYDLAEKSQDPTLKPMLVYASSKVAGEKEVWKFVETHKPEFRVNTVLPDLVLGKIKNPAPGTYSTGTGLLTFAAGSLGFLEIVFANPSYFVDVEDTAKIHVAALLDESVNGRRLWAAAAPLSGAAVQEAVKEAKPDYHEKDLSAFPGLPNIIIDNKVSIDLLQKHYGHGFQSLKQSVRNTLL